MAFIPFADPNKAAETLNTYDGSLYYNPDTGGIEQYSNGSWSPYSLHTAGGGGGGGGGGGWGPSQSAATGPDYSANYAALDASERRLRDLLGQADITRDQGLTQLEGSYQGQVGKANQDRTRVLEDYATKRETTTRGKNESLGKVDTNARNLNDSLRRILGLASGSGSSAFQLAAPEAVSRQASQQRQGVLNNYGENFRQLDTAESRAKIDFEDLLTDLMNQRKQREYDLRSGTDQQKQGILAQLGDIASQRAALRGGGAGAQVAAAQPFQDQYDSLQRGINDMFSRFQPTVQSKQVNPQQVALSNYTVDKAAINANRQFGGDAYSPYAQFLKRQRDQQA